ncbi:MAG: ZIP family metal transporter [archaeon]|nr:ZIP family metal transporter [archaeon]
MLETWLYALVSVIIVSLISLIGLATISINTESFKKYVHYLVSFSAGALMGDAFIHLLPEAVKDHGFGIEISAYILFGILLFFIIEKFIRWRHCHVPTSEQHPHPVAIINLIGDAVHNFIDGLIIGASYAVSIPVGIATTVAVILHEIPQEIGDFGILIHAGFSRKKALVTNFLSALTAVLGTIVALTLTSYVENISLFLVPFGAGVFIYISGSDLIPELHKNDGQLDSFIELIFFIMGIVIMASLLLLE